MLWQRVFTAIPLAALVIWLILFQSTEIVIYVLLAVTLLSGLEWARLAGVPQLAWRFGYAVMLSFVAWYFLEQQLLWVRWYIMLAALWWLLIAVYLPCVKPETITWRSSLLTLLSGLLIVPAAVMAMTILHAGFQGPQWLLYGLLLVWLADIGAYFSGRRFGKNKLAPDLSPGKTREGLYGALLTTTLYSLIASVYFDLELTGIVLLLVLSILLTLVSVVGDLYESLLKRTANLKDSGKLLPGHGGMLDRIDSVLAAMPVLVVGLHWWIQPFFRVTL